VPYFGPCFPFVAALFSLWGIKQCSVQTCKIHSLHESLAEISRLLLLHRFGAHKGKIGSKIGLYIGEHRHQNRALNRETLKLTIVHLFYFFVIKMRWEYLHGTNLGLTKLMEVSICNIDFTKIHVLQNLLFSKHTKQSKTPKKVQRPQNTFCCPTGPFCGLMGPLWCPMGPIGPL